ncbi:hypothetical protein DFH28DRAFT_657163 [Melampsora americana]|nr:hypothetical protein DFH28DRAFT_657163 [Melampsora americana]
MLKTSYFIILTLVWHANHILSSPVLSLTHDLSNARDIEAIHATDIYLPLKHEEQIGRGADNLDQPKAVVLGFMHEPEKEPKILLTQRVAHDEIPIEEGKLKNPEFPRGHLLKDELEMTITFERLKELRKGPLRGVMIPPGSSSDHILELVMQIAGINKNDKDAISQLAAFRELYEETGHWGVLKKVDTGIYFEAKPEKSRKVLAGDNDVNKKELRPYIFEIPPGQIAARTLESRGRELRWSTLAEVARLVQRDDMVKIWTDLRGYIIDIAKENTKKHQYKLDTLPPLITAT